MLGRQYCMLYTAACPAIPTLLRGNHLTRLLLESADHTYVDSGTSRNCVSGQLVSVYNVRMHGMAYVCGYS